MPSDSLPKKILSTEVSEFLTVRVKDDVYILEFPFATTVQVVESKQAECYFDAVKKQLPNMRDVTGLVHRREELPTTDGDTSMAKADRWRGHVEDLQDFARLSLQRCLCPDSSIWLHEDGK